MLLQTLGRDEDAVREAGDALALQPLSPAALSDAGRMLYRARRYTEAMVRFDDALRIEPEFVPALLRRLDVMFVTDLSAYRADATKLQLLAAKVPTFAIELERARVAARFDHAADPRAIAAGIENAGHATRRGENSFTLALIYAAFSDRARTLTALEEGGANDRCFRCNCGTLNSTWCGISPASRRCSRAYGWRPRQRSPLNAHDASTRALV